MTWFTTLVSNTCLLVQTTAFLTCTIQYFKQLNTNTKTLTSQTKARCVHFTTHDTDDSSDIITDLSGCCVTFYNIFLNIRSILELQILFMASICLPRLLSPAPPYGIAVRYEDLRYGCKIQEGGEHGSVNVPPSSDIRIMWILRG